MSNIIKLRSLVTIQGGEYIDDLSLTELEPKHYDMLLVLLTLDIRIDYSYTTWNIYKFLDECITELDDIYPSPEAVEELEKEESNSDEELEEIPW